MSSKKEKSFNPCGLNFIVTILVISLLSLIVLVTEEFSTTTIRAVKIILVLMLEMSTEN